MIIVVFVVDVLQIRQQGQVWSEVGKYLEQAAEQVVGHVQRAETALVVVPPAVEPPVRGILPGRPSERIRAITNPVDDAVFGCRPGDVTTDDNLLAHSGKRAGRGQHARADLLDPVLP